MSDSLHDLTDDLTKSVNSAFSSGVVPKDVFNAMAGVTAATAFALGADDEDVCRLFTKFACNVNRMCAANSNTGRPLKNGSIR